jgi:competence ComEA-like helix-hairpin-helix protein
MKKLVLMLFILVLINTLSASCSSDQIDVNTASLEKLDEITYIGPAKAQAIIDARPYQTLDDLVNAYGIGEATLEKVKAQGLACVEGENNEEGNPKVKIEQEKDSDETSKPLSFIEAEKTKEKYEQTIQLSPQTIKSENSEIEEGNYAFYGLAVFCILLLGLFIAKNLKFKKDKNEFG